MKKLNNNAQLWVDALKSGKFKQVKGALKLKRGYCCLGVACEVYQKVTGHKIRKGVLYYGHNALLPRVVQKWLGLTSDSGSFAGGELTELNDEEVTFLGIAQIIGMKPEGLFKKGK